MIEKEIERKWLLKDSSIDDVIEHPFVNIEQGYYDSLRLRKINHGQAVTYLQTIKVGTGLDVDEHECEMFKFQFETFWPLTENMRITKKRYFLNDNITVDLIIDNDTTLFLIEKEFPTITEANNYIAPNWFGEEVTNNPIYKNINIAKNGIQEN